MVFVEQQMFGNSQQLHTLSKATVLGRFWGTIYTDTQQVTNVLCAFAGPDPAEAGPADFLGIWEGLELTSTCQ